MGKGLVGGRREEKKISGSDDEVTCKQGRKRTGPKKAATGRSLALCNEESGFSRPIGKT